MAKNILLVKTSSLGDVIHAMPAVSDVYSQSAAGGLDWVVEESLESIARLHGGVRNVIPVAIRRWRGSWWRSKSRIQIMGSLRRLRVQEYDAIIDAQGLFKSALLALAARGRRYGLDFHSSREPLGVFYHHTFRVPWELHAVERNRLLMAKALGYEVPEGCNYGVTATPRSFDWLSSGPYAVLLHASSGDDKLWPEPNWMALGKALNVLGMTCVLPWGSTRERERSMRIGESLRDAVVPPGLQLDQVGGLLAGAQIAVGVDTGLTHFAAALGIPTVGIYIATDPAATGIYGCGRAINIGTPGVAPAFSQVMTAIETVAL